VAHSLHAVANMRRDVLMLLFAALAAISAPLALHFYNKARTLEADLGLMQGRLQSCTEPR
jgi:hypothetical protein